MLSYTIAMKTLDHIGNFPALGKMLCCPYIGTNYCMDICERWEVNKDEELCTFLCSECDKYERGCVCSKDALPYPIDIPKMDDLPQGMLRYYGDQEALSWVLYDPNCLSLVTYHGFYDTYGSPPEGSFYVYEWGVLVMGPCPFEVG